MRVRLWWWSRSWLIGVALATAIAGTCAPGAPAQAAPDAAGPDRYRLAAVPEPPTPPRPPTQSLAEPPRVQEEAAEEELVEAEPDGGLGVRIRAAFPVLAGPDERSDGPWADTTVRVPPGLPVPDLSRGGQCPGGSADRPLRRQGPRAVRHVDLAVGPLPAHDPANLPGARAARGARVHGDDRVRILAPGGLAGRRQGDVAVHGGHGAALRSRHRPLAGRASRSGEVHDGGGRVPRGSLRPVRATGSWPRRATTRARPAWGGRSSVRGRATSGP